MFSKNKNTVDFKIIERVTLPRREFFKLIVKSHSFPDRPNPPTHAFGICL